MTVVDVLSGCIAPPKRSDSGVNRMPHRASMEVWPICDPRSWAAQPSHGLQGERIAGTANGCSRPSLATGEMTNHLHPTAQDARPPNPIVRNWRIRILGPMTTAPVG